MKTKQAKVIKMLSYHRETVVLKIHARVTRIELCHSLPTSSVIRVGPTGQQPLQEGSHSRRGQGSLGETERLEVVHINCEGVWRAGGSTDLNQLREDVPHFDL